MANVTGDAMDRNDVDCPACEGFDGFNRVGDGGGVDAIAVDTVGVDVTAVMPSAPCSRKDLAEYCGVVEGTIRHNLQALGTFYKDCQLFDGANQLTDFAIREVLRLREVGKSEYEPVEGVPTAPRRAKGGSLSTSAPIIPEVFDPSFGGDEVLGLLAGAEALLSEAEAEIDQETEELDALVQQRNDGLVQLAGTVDRLKTKKAALTQKRAIEAANSETIGAVAKAMLKMNGISQGD